MSDQWGSVDGDTNASAIMSDRRPDASSLQITVAVFFVLLLISAGAYASYGSRMALAAEIVFAAICAAGWVRTHLYVTHTFVMIAERRSQLLEQQVQALRGQVADLQRGLDRPYSRSGAPFG